MIRQPRIGSHRAHGGQVHRDRLAGWPGLRGRTGRRPPGDRDTHTTVDEARDWARHSQEPFDVKIFPGGHFYLTEQAPAVLTTIREHFATAPPRS
ncbi:hypothetical protein ITP53_05740 [Nonomuraea sp. K274]|uniref:Thioesterase domain-containing protein n=1 Tax=Nonomuraea cypriaca TaxID=1187855 RepID=A0A931A8C0_9ACTN|nr:thioesterase domain-containing protein [Nonomuraea cypriaca]MBF8185245.1 hypothetical protein [Nonomuraea cypriaca]